MVIPVAKRRGVKVFTWSEDVWNPAVRSVEKIQEKDLYGRNARTVCFNNPDHHNFLMGLMEDFTRSYELDGIMWGSERYGAFGNMVESVHNRNGNDPSLVTCFCNFCQEKARGRGINVDRAFEGFRTLEAWVRSCRGGKRPTDGYHVTLWRILFRYRLKPEEEWPDGDNNVIIYKTESVIVELTTDVGLKGIGGASRYNGPAEMKEYAEAVVKPAILDKNPFDVEYLAAGLCGPRARGVWAGVDTAMWDIIGKAKGLPLYKILATDTEPVTHIRMYASGGEFTWQKGSRFVGPDDLVKQARRHKAAGYTAFKYRPGGGFARLGIKMADFIPYMRDLRQAVGPNFDLIQEANTRWSMEQCIAIAPVLEELKYLWWEEPTRKNVDDYVKLKKYLSNVKISGGETMPNRATLAEWVDRGAYDIVQPGCDDAGVTECWHMARMAGSRGKLICPHNWQDGLITAANAHLLAAVPNRFLLESNMTPNPFKEGLFKEKFQAVNGYIDVPQKPGLGVELKDGLEELYAPIPGNWNMPDPNFPR